MDLASAVRDGRVIELKSTYILQPGPACLTECVRQLHALLTDTTASRQRSDQLPDVYHRLD